MRNHEVTTVQRLLNADGEIAEPGWARSQVWEYRRRDIKAPALRIKEWDYYLVMGQGFAAAFTVSDDGYIGLQSVSLLVLDEEHPWEHTETVLTAFPMGKMKLPENSAEGDILFDNGRLKLSYTLSEEKRRIQCVFQKFDGDKALTADITLSQPPMDTLVIATPWDKKHAFYYNQKIGCMRAEGWVRYDGAVYEFRPETDFATLDWGRGVWTYDNTWLWSSLNADVCGHAFGLNLGYGFGNTSAASENVIFYDGKAHKLDDVTFHIPEESWVSPWTIDSSDGRLAIDFVPILDRAANMDFKVIVSDQHQVFGKMSGRAVLDDGSVVEFHDCLAFAEKVHNRY